MKNAITLFLLAFCFSNQISFAQLEVTGSTDFGRIFDITYDATVPNKLYAHTLGNHILVSEDNGNSWDIMYSILNGQSARVEKLRLTADGSALTFSAYFPNSNLNEIRVFDLDTESIIRTYPLPNQRDNAFVRSYHFYEGDMDVLIVDTNYKVGFDVEGKTFYTADGGANWDMIYYTNDNDTVFINGVAISPTNPQKVFLTRSNGSTDIEGGLFVSNDAGQTWEEKLSGIILDPITFDPTNPENIWIGTGYGSTIENIYKSTDNGETFNAVSISWTDGIMDSINVIKFNENNPSQIIVLEENEIVISEDGGTTWESYVYLEDNPESYYYGLNATYNPNDSQEIFISANYVPLHSTDGGETIAWFKTPYFASTGNMDIHSSDAAANLYYGVQFGYAHRDLNTGEDTAYDILPLNMMANDVGITQFADKITPNRLYTFSSGFMGTTLNVSDDNGETKNFLHSIFTNKITAVATFSNSPSTIMAAFAGYEPSETQLLKIDFSDVTNVSVTDVTLPNLNLIMDIDIDDAGLITMPVGAEVYQSTDEGATWVNSSDGLERMNDDDLIFQIDTDPFNPERMAFACTQGVFISEDGGSSWTQKLSGYVSSVAFSTETEGAMVAATYNSEFTEYALHYSEDSGESWTTIDNDQLLGIGAQSSAYVFDESSVTVYIGTYDIGLVEYTIDFNVLEIDEFTKTLDPLTIYPNPTSDVLNVALKNTVTTHITVYSLTGSKVVAAESVIQLDISNLDSGVYMVRVQDDANAVYFKRIVKR
ncbi:T9SS type A sorting domain-containing protein [Aequorivita viscosa]|uniref:Por secretion system C-terminal sorting domain-containing protein n=1 Tax=Aequorivita viscosa TaxID=797419 RepID=A0A1M6GH84_9FLAO|nr:T9SS type A sorting domain-containing protein [Aequorivita viscosa]SDW84457.1 Por secretion system C-terminal sorting domain-containing protein [Aequorivita viscosa]SHJ09336.1 Por secretion system C-terminal sorting domain-containing protein [Aequorivita viscosa]